MKNSSPSINETILPLQHCKFTREQNESDEEWMGHIKIKVDECGYKEKNNRNNKRY